ncbi:MAG: hypothetical protein QOF58_4005 [Pseudonocardiales bacterium]|jgi:hypothetical protein|nr:hypothetical protein [Pseudonocardiales bacterium]
MGWIAYHRPPGETDREHFSRQLFQHSDYKIVECSTVDDVFYAAVRTTSTDEVWALIVLMEHRSGDAYNFAYKYLSETAGPVTASAPAKVLDALTPTTNTYALEWRANCRERLTGTASRRTPAKRR